MVLVGSAADQQTGRVPVRVRVADTQGRLRCYVGVTVRFPGYATHAETIALMRSSDLLFLPMHDLPIGHRAGLVPGKTYEYMASRKPILAAVPDGDARELLEEAGSAFLCRPTDVSAMTKIISERFDSWEAGEPGPEPRPEVLQRYERRELTRQLAAVFDRLVGRSVSGERKPAPPERSRTRSPQP